MGFVLSIHHYLKHRSRKLETRKILKRKGISCLRKFMASFAITASMQRAYNSHNVRNSQHPQSHARSSRSFATKQSSHFVTLDIETPNSITINEPERLNSLVVDKPKKETLEKNGDLGGEDDVVQKFMDERWKNGTWDLNMFVKNGKMDWDGVIVAEARRRKFLEVYPQVSTNQEQVLFRSSIIPWWAWITHSHLPEAELLNGRAAMVGFFMAYLVDALTGLNMVGQAGNFVCKVGLFMTVFGILLFRKKEDLGKLKSLADEATFYDKQWQASWQDQDLGGGTSK